MNIENLKFIIDNIKVDGHERRLDKFNQMIDWKSLSEEDALKMKDIYQELADEIKNAKEKEPITSVIIKRGDWETEYPAEVISSVRDKKIIIKL